MPQLPDGKPGECTSVTVWPNVEEAQANIKNAEQYKTDRPGNPPLFIFHPPQKYFAFLTQLNANCPFTVYGLAVIFVFSAGVEFWVDKGADRRS